MRINPVVPLLLVVPFLGCGGTAQDGRGLTATASFDLQQAPADAVCVQLVITGATRTSTKNFILTTGQGTTSLTASGLPTGAVIITGNAYGVLCGAVTGLTPATWLVTPANPTFTVAGPNSVALTLTRNGQATLGFDFQDDQHAVSTLAGTAGAPGSADGFGAAARFNSPVGVAADNAGNLYVADSGNNTIRKIVIATGAVTTVAGNAALAAAEVDGVGAAARLNGPNGLALDATGGNLYISDASGCTVRKMVLATAAVTTIAGQPCNSTDADGTGTAARFLTPQGLALDGAGNLYVANQGTIRQIVLATAAVTTIAGLFGVGGYTDGAAAASARFSNAHGIAFDGGALWITDAGSNNVIRKLTLGPGSQVSTVAGSTSTTEADGVGTAAAFNAPAGIAPDGRGNLIVTDQFGYTVRKLVEANGVVLTIGGTAGVFGGADGVGSVARFNGPIAATVDSAGAIYLSDLGNGTIRKL